MRRGGAFMRKLLLPGVVVVAAFAVSGCASVTPAWKIYDACARQTTTFVDMVQCGKTQRTATCEKAQNCSTLGDAFVQYADGLAMQVQNHEISEGEARTRFAQYKTQVISDVRRDQTVAAAGIAAGAAASGPKTCTAIGNTVNCF